MKKFSLWTMSLVMALTVKAQNGTDMTDLLTNADFEDGSTGWTIVGGFATIGTAAQNGYSGVNFMEDWTKAPNTLPDLDCSQTVSVENGLYVMTALAHAIQQGDPSLAITGMELYANEDVVAVTTTSTAEYKVATLVTDGSLRVGYRGISTNANWVAWDNVRLMRYEGATIEEARLNWVLNELNSLAETALELTEEKMQVALVEGIQHTVVAIADVTTYEAGAALLETLKSQVVAARASIEVYGRLLIEIEVANAELEKDFYEGLDEFYVAIDAAQGVYDAAEASTDEVEAAIVKLKEDVFTFQMLNANGEIGFDVTDRYMTNPTLRMNSDGWEGSVPSLQYEVMEFYNCDYDMYQTLTGVPDGMYVVHVQGFYRVGANDGGAAYQAGTERIPALLYANEASVPMLSLYTYTAADMGVTSSKILNGYVNVRESTNEAFNLTNPELGIPYYAENALTVFVSGGTLKIGLRNSEHASLSWCTFRDFKLEYYGNFPGVVLGNRLAEAQTWLDEHMEVLPEAAVAQLQDAIMDAEEYTYPDLDAEEVEKAIAVFDAHFASVKNVVVLLADLAELLGKAEELITLNYPGITAFKEVYDAVAAIADAGSELVVPEEYTTEVYLQEALASLREAIQTYYESQVGTPENPADYTFRIVLPTFQSVKDKKIPAPWVVNNVMNGGDVWVGPCQPDAAGDGTTHLPGLNSWSGDFTTMDVHQDIEGLPNGVYTVSARAITQGLGQQHAYATSSVGTAVSEDMTIVGWETYEWETLQTEKVVVLDGKLRIGFASVSAGGVNGWYQVTDFKLQYYGPATNEDLKGAWESSLERANEYASVLLPGDTKDVKAAIEAATPMAAEGRYADACAALNPAILASDSIFHAVQIFYGGNYEALIDMGAELDDNVNTSAARLLAITMQMVGQALQAEDATHTILPVLDAKLGGYVAYATALIEAENTLAVIKGVKAEDIAFVKEQIAAQVDDLTAELRLAADCADLQAKLEKLMKAIESSLNLSLPAGDLTEDLVVNPTIDDAAATGWTIVKGTGKNGPTNKGQHYDGTAANLYLDSWNPTTGTLNFNVSSI